MKLLIVDDNEDFRKYLIKKILKDNNEIYELDDGQNVTDTYKKFNPDFVLMDIKMKKINGFIAAVRLKEQFPEARIIMVSEYADEKFKSRATKVGAEALVSKENLFELEALISKK